MKKDLQFIGISGGSRRFRVAASATRFYVGEPIHNVGTYTSGAISVNTWVVAAADTPVIGTHNFAGLANRDAKVNSAGTVIAQTGEVAVPIASVTRIRGKAETAASIDTDAELLALLYDATLIDYSSTGSALSGPLYTIKEAASANSSGLVIVDGDIAKGTLDVIVSSNALRQAVA